MDGCGAAVMPALHRAEPEGEALRLPVSVSSQLPSGPKLRVVTRRKKKIYVANMCFLCVVQPQAKEVVEERDSYYHVLRDGPTLAA